MERQAQAPMRFKFGEKSLRPAFLSTECDEGEGGSAAESITLSEELLPEFYDLRSSVREDQASDVMMAPPAPFDSTSYIVRDLVDRVERLSRENASLKRSTFNLDAGPGEMFHSTSVGPEVSRVSFFEPPTRDKGSEVPQGNSQLHERLVVAIDRHREAVDDLRDVLQACWTADTPIQTFAASYLESRGPSILRWKMAEAYQHRSRIAPSSPLVNLRKPIWFRDLRTNE